MSIGLAKKLEELAGDKVTVIEFELGYSISSPGYSHTLLDVINDDCVIFRENTTKFIEYIPISKISILTLHDMDI